MERIKDASDIPRRVERDVGNGMSWMRLATSVGRPIQSVVVCEGTEVLSSGGRPRSRARTDHRPGAGGNARNGPGGPVPVEPELLSDSEEGARNHGPILDRGPGRDQARVQQAEAPPPQGGHTRVHG